MIHTRRRSPDANLAPDEGIYTTAHELAFLAGLGEFAKGCLTPRPALLRRYLQSMSQRREWGGINQNTVYLEARKMLQKDGPGKEK